MATMPLPLPLPLPAPAGLLALLPPAAPATELSRYTSTQASVVSTPSRIVLPLPPPPLLDYKPGSGSGSGSDL